MSETEHTEEVSEKTPRWWHKVAWFALAPRVVLGVLGLAALFVGLRAAWHTDAATPALVVAAVLIALAVLFTPDLEELSARWKDAGVTYRRKQAFAYAEVSEVLQVALQEEGEESLRTTIAEIATESSRAAVRQELEADRSVSNLARYLAMHTRPPQRKPTPISELFERSLAASERLSTATHAIEEGQVTLTLTNPPTRSLVANVARPDGTEHTKIVFRLGDAPSASVTFPRDFGPQVAPLSAGRHTVSWRSMTVLPAGDGGRVRPQIGPVIASEEFDFPDVLAEQGEGDEQNEGGDGQ